MYKAYINSLLRDIPTDVDYTELPEDIHPEDIPPERIKGVVDLLAHEDDYIVFQAARLLTSWGIEEGFDALKKLLVENELQGMIQHRIYGYDETYKHVLYAFISYWANQSDAGKGEQARKAIFEPVSIIIKASNTQLFQIDKIFRLVLDDDFNEYIPLLKEHLQIIIKNLEDNYWRIHDVIELFLNIDSDFVLQVLKENDKKLSDFGF